MEKAGETFETYDYERIRAGSQRSADVIVPWLLDLVKPRHVLDVGCGEGWFAKKFEELGVKAYGVDYERPETCAIDQFFEWDLSRPVRERDDGWFAVDLVLCLETAEHLPPERGPSLVADLISASPVVAFSAAVPGQGGHGHINERWPSYWADIFAGYDYRPDGRIREELWDDKRVEPWYRQNLLVFYDESRPVFPKPLPLDIVHPEIFGWKL